MSGHDYWEPGGWNIQCFACGFKRKASEMRKQWQGYWTCPDCWTPRQPQDFVRGIPDNPSVPFVQPLNWVYVGPDIIDVGAIILEDLSDSISTETLDPLITE